jgi:AcrR family transcriptional regulator
VPRPKQRTPELRDRVLQAAVAMLADEGVAGLTTRRVAHDAGTSIPAVYELFGDKAGLVREIYFEGFRSLLGRFDAVPVTDDPAEDLVAVAGVFRSFVRANPVLSSVMFARPFADFDPGPDELRASGSVREFFVSRVRRGIESGVLAGDPTDIAHVLLALGQGLAAQESAGWLGRSAASRNRRWTLAYRTLLAGLRPDR